MTAPAQNLHVSLIAIPEAVISTLSDIYDVLNSFGMLQSFDEAIPAAPPFTVEIVGATDDPVELASGFPVQIHRRFDEVAQTDIVIVADAVWSQGPYPELVAWVSEMHARGATLCSACSGIFLLAETGLFDGKEATVHWGYAQKFQNTYPDIPASPERVLVVSGEREQLVSSGASTSWHDLVLYLITRHVGATAAQAVANFFALQWHRDGLAPYIVFEAQTDHGDAVAGDAQKWLASNFAVANPVEEMVKRAGLPKRTFKRRFTKATGYTPINYVQRLRVEDAKRRIERTEAPIDEISWRVGYEDPAFFRRLFKRVTSFTPGAYRQKFKTPDYAA